MAVLFGLFFISTLYLLHSTSAKNCGPGDFKTQSLPCDQTTRTRKIVTYLDNKEW
jgi:hypothetical protein